MIKTNEAHRTQFVRWLENRVIADARGDDLEITEIAPNNRLWLGRLASVESTQAAIRNERFQRLDPCAVGFVFKPIGPPPWTFTLVSRMRTWSKNLIGDGRSFVKSIPIEVSLDIVIDSSLPRYLTPIGQAQFHQAFAERLTSHSARIDIEISASNHDPTIAVSLVNATSLKRGFDELLYEVSLEALDVDLTPFVLDDLPDSFRYDRTIPARGINAGVEYTHRRLVTTDFVGSEKLRPTYWDHAIGPEPTLEFKELSTDPISSLQRLMDLNREWTAVHWSETVLDQRAANDNWSPQMRASAATEAVKAFEEVALLNRGLEVLKSREDVLRAFKLMNEAFLHSGSRKGYTSWRPFQIAFVLLALPGLIDSDDIAHERVDVLWFATGGGKTETYLALVVLMCFLDRIRGKHFGISAWSRFPLRMLSLQQTQRFADALAGAELARVRARLGGEVFALGYFVGRGTPNRIHLDEASIESSVDYRDPTMPEKFRLLAYCPFCFEESVTMSFDETLWRLKHCCTNTDCPWLGSSLPLYIVDDEIYRLLPAVLVGTIDKAALAGHSGAARGLVGAPLGQCSGDGHGFTYGKRSKTPNGCLVPGCQHTINALPQATNLFAMGLRVQDELHLLADSLGAIDAQYETLLDQLTIAIGGCPPKIVGSSATLAGFQEQVMVLYARTSCAFPLPGPTTNGSFWSQQTDRLMRRFVALAPRGQTQEFAADRIARSLQEAVRLLQSDPIATCLEIGVEPSSANDLLDEYGTDVFYGLKIPDVQAMARSFESQPPANPTNVEQLTGGSELSDVRSILDRLGSAKEPDFNDRIHIICASSMMAHGVDIDRFNVMTILGVPLKTSEFIQTSARIGRRYPGLVFVLHRMVYERDAKVYGSFDSFVQHGDRFVEPIAITRKSRNVLQKTLPGAFVAQLLHIEEPRRLSIGGKPLTTVKEVRAYLRESPDLKDRMKDALVLAASIDRTAQPVLTRDISNFIENTFLDFERAKDMDYPPRAMNPAPLQSLRDVETTVPIREAMDR